MNPRTRIDGSGGFSKKSGPHALSGSPGKRAADSASKPGPRQESPCRGCVFAGAGSLTNARKGATMSPAAPAAFAGPEKSISVSDPFRLKPAGQGAADDAASCGRAAQSGRGNTPAFRALRRRQTPGLFPGVSHACLRGWSVSVGADRPRFFEIKRCKC